MSGFAKKILLSLRDFIYPPLCLHCQETMSADWHCLCRYCLEHLERIDPQERCPYCFSSQYDQEYSICEECGKKEPLLHRIAATYDYVGPAAALIRQLKYGNQPHLAKGIAALMALQFIALDWPFPDMIIPVPISLTHRLERGYNQSLLIAQALGLLLERPAVDILKRTSGDYSQAGLSRQERLQLTGNSFMLQNGAKVADRQLLLVDDVMTTGSTLRRCAEVLLHDGPLTIYALTACRAI